MTRIEKTVFISYRRTDVYTALAVYENLKNQGYDVFFDYRSISSGDFEQIIHSNIRARAHFLLILTPAALERCDEPGDWLRREIEIAMDEKRNIIPLFFKGFRFGAPSIREKLTGKLSNLSSYNGLNVHEDYFDEAMDRLRTQYLNRALNTILHPVSTEVRRVVKEEQLAADKALEEIEAVKELVKQPKANLNEPQGESHTQSVEVPKQESIGEKSIETQRRVSSLSSEGDKHVDMASASQDHVIPEKRKSLLTPNLRLFIAVASILVFVPLCIMASANYATNNLFDFVTVTPSPTIAVSSTFISQPNKTDTPSPTRTSSPLTQITVSPTATLGIGSIMTGEDGMTLLYVPAGEFIMGSDYYSDAQPVRNVYLDAFWIDKTEVTNEMYALCVAMGVCKEPNSKISKTRTSYFSEEEFGNYPVVFVDWAMASTYCKWVGRRLPTEAEWEKAARGTEGYTFPWGSDPPNPNLLNFDEAIGGDTTEVGYYEKGASPYGALDMAGNVWEWVEDWYDSTHYSKSPASNPPGPVSGQRRVLRGGSWSSWEFLVRSTFRYRDDPSYMYYGGVGFRCAMSATP